MTKFINESDDQKNPLVQIFLIMVKMPTKQILFYAVCFIVSVWLWFIAYDLWKPFKDCGPVIWKGTRMDVQKHSATEERRITVDYKITGAREITVSGLTFERTKLGDQFCSMVSRSQVSDIGILGIPATLVVIVEGLVIVSLALYYFGFFIAVKIFDYK